MRAVGLGCCAVLVAAWLTACESGDESKSSSSGGATSGGTSSTGGTGGGGAAVGGSGASSGGSSAGGGGSAGAGGGSTGGASSGGAAGSGGQIGACPTFADAVKTGNVAFTGVTEASGIVESRKNPGVLWVNNDSGDGPKLYAMTKDGKHLGVFTFQGAQAVDWEDIATGPGPKAGETYLYAGDIGDNPSTRPNIKIYRVAEPSVNAAAPAADVTLSGVETFTYTYADGPHNAETLLVDPKTSDLFIVTKVGSGKSQVFRAPAPLASGVLQEVASLTFGAAPLVGGAATTGGDISPSGDAIAVRTYTHAYLWRRGGGMTVAQAFAGEPCPLPQKSEPQGEALGFAADGLGFYTVSEGSQQPIYFFAKK